MGTVVITGLSSGIGQAVRNIFLENGWRVIGVSRHIPLDQEGYEADLSMLESVEPLATRIGEECKPIDAFIHIAGVWHDESGVLAGKKFHEFSTKQIINTMNVGVTSAMILSARLMPFMNQNSKMIFISGTFQDGGANWLPYFTSKKSLEVFLKGLSEDETGNVKVIGVSPADTATESYKKYYPEQANQAQSPESVARVCLDLADDQLPAESGSILEVRDGRII